MSKDFEKYKRYYNKGFWNEERIKNIVNVGKITKEEFEQIVGKKFEE